MTTIQQLLRGLGLAFSGLVEASARVFQGVGVYPADTLYYLIAMLTMDAPGLKPLWYRVLALSVPLLGVAMVVGVLWQVLWRGEELDLLDYGRELLWALTIMLAAPTIYNTMAGLCNAVALSIAQLGQANAVYGTALSTVAPYAGVMAAAASLALIFLAVVGLLKWLLASTIIAVSPLLAVAYLVPPFRRAVDAAATLLAQLWVASLLASALTGMMSALYTGGGEAFTALAYAIAMPLVYVVSAPLILQLTGMP